MDNNNRLRELIENAEKYVNDRLSLSVNIDKASALSMQGFDKIESLILELPGEMNEELLIRYKNLLKKEDELEIAFMNHCAAQMGR